MVIDEMIPSNFSSKVSVLKSFSMTSVSQTNSSHLFLNSKSIEGELSTAVILDTKGAIKKLKSPVPAPKSIIFIDFSSFIFFTISSAIPFAFCTRFEFISQDFDLFLK